MTTTTTEAFEAHYQRSAEDSASAEMLAIWEAAWNAATERAAKLCEEQAGCASFVNNIGATFAAEQCAAAIRASSGKGDCDA